MPDFHNRRPIRNRLLDNNNRRSLYYDCFLYWSFSFNHRRKFRDSRLLHSKRPLNSDYMCYIWRNLFMLSFNLEYLGWPMNNLFKRSLYWYYLWLSINNFFRLFFYFGRDNLSLDNRCLLSIICKRKLDSWWFVWILIIDLYILCILLIFYYNWCRLGNCSSRRLAKTNNWNKILIRIRNLYRSSINDWRAVAYNRNFWCLIKDNIFFFRYIFNC